MHKVEVISCVSGGSIIGAYYYLRIIKTIYFDDPAPAYAPSNSVIENGLIAVTAVAVSPLGYLLVPFLALTAFMAAVVWLQRGAVALESNIANLLLSTAVGMAAYLVPLALFRPAMLRQVLRPFKG